jgi:colanic acid/amylovoran biosynthesis glycosyltransferase
VSGSAVREESAAGKRVLHAFTEFGIVTEGFLTERIAELDRLGWEGWVATRSVVNRGLFPFPPESRFLLARPRVVWRALNRLSPRSRYGLHTSRWMARPIATARPALVHAHFGWTAAEVLPAVKRFRLPLVAGFHGDDATVFRRHGFIDQRLVSLKLPFGWDPYRRLFDEVDAVLVVSRFLEGKLRRLGFEREVHVVPSGICLGDFPYQGPRPDDGELRLLFVGRHVAYKGLDVLLRALTHLQAHVPAVRLDVIGDGPLQERSHALAAELGIARQVIFHGAQPRAEVVRALQAADVLVAPSRTTPIGEAEALGNVTKEAMAVGLQVVATRHGGLPETFPPRWQKELVPENDARALADRIMELLNDRGSWPERALHGRAWVEEAFDWPKLGERIASVYEQVVEAHAQAAMVKGRNA